MNIFRLQNNVPDVYVNKSRDFQIFCRLVDLYFATTKNGADGVLKTLSATTCPDNLLQLLQSKVGYVSYDVTVYTEQLRKILDVFPYLIKQKGTYAGIYKTVGLFLRINNINTKYQVDIINKSFVKITSVEHNWSTVFNKYYRKINNKFIKLSLIAPEYESSKTYYFFDTTYNKYIKLSTMPSNWQTNYYDYFEGSVVDGVTTYTPVAGVIPANASVNDPVYRKDSVYEIRIIMYTQNISNIDLLRNILSYIVPTGYTLDILQSKNFDNLSTDIDTSDNVVMENVSVNVNSAVAPYAVSTLKVGTVKASSNVKLGGSVSTLNAVNVGAVDTTGIIDADEVSTVEQLNTKTITDGD